MTPKWKRPGKGIFSILLALVLSTTIYFACDEIDDRGLDVNAFALITGDLTLNSVVPDTTDEIIFALIDNLEAGDPLASTTAIPKRSLTVDSTTTSQTVGFKMDAELGNYLGLFAIWKQKGTPLSREGEPLSIFENVVGSYCDGGSLIPLNITEENSIMEGVEVNVDLTKVNRTARVAGTIVFQGGAASWPDDIENLVIATVNFEGIDAGEAIEKLFEPIDVCFLLERLDIHFLPKNPVDSYDFAYDLAAGGTLLVVAGNRKGQLLFEPSLFIDTGKIGTGDYEGSFKAVANSTIELNPITADFGLGL